MLLSSIRLNEIFEGEMMSFQECKTFLQSEVELAIFKNK